MKIHKNELEKLIMEEIDKKIEEGIFSKIFKKGADKLRTKNVAKNTKLDGSDIEVQDVGREQEKFDKKTKQNIIRISAEILSDPINMGVKTTKTIKKIDPTSLGLKTAVSKTDIFREQEVLEEATPKEMRMFTKMLRDSLKKGTVTFQGLLDDIISLSKTNSVVKAIYGVDKLVSQFEKQQEPPEKEVEDDQIEFTGPEEFKTAEELPADEGGIKGSTAPRPSPLPSSLPQGNSGLPQGNSGLPQGNSGLPSDLITSGIKDELEKAENVKQMRDIANSYGKEAIKSDKELLDFYKQKIVKLAEIERALKNVKAETDLEPVILKYDNDIRGNEYLKNLYNRKAQKVRNLSEAKRWQKLAGILKD